MPSEANLNAPTAPQIPIVFMGTPQFSAAILESLVLAGYHIVGVVTRPDQPTGRDQNLTESAVKRAALAHHLPLFQPQKLDEVAFDQIKNLKPDLILVAAYGKILPEKFLALPGLGCINVHASLLPRWRGASPIQNALMAGDRETGITLMLMDAGIDTGDIIATKSLPIDPLLTAEGLSMQLSLLASALLREMLPEWVKRSITPQPQNAADATLCQLIEREDGRVFWNSSAEELYNRYRGLSPWPGLFTFWKKGNDLIRLKLLKVSFQKTNPVKEEAVGTVYELGEKIGVQTGAGVLFLERIQLEGKAPIDMVDFLNGNSDFVGSVLV